MGKSAVAYLPTKETPDIQIEEGVPIPQSRAGCLPFDAMKVGDSFFIQGWRFLRCLSAGRAISKPLYRIAARECAQGLNTAVKT